MFPQLAHLASSECSIHRSGHDASQGHNESCCVFVTDVEIDSDMKRDTLPAIPAVAAHAVVAAGPEALARAVLFLTELAASHYLGETIIDICLPSNTIGPTFGDSSLNA